MPSPVRLDPELMADAESEARLSKRSVPKQIELWAELGRLAERVLGHGELLALRQGTAELRVEPVQVARVEPDDVFAALDRDRADGSLAARVTSAVPRYEASATHPGLLDRVDVDGRREPGRFEGGRFRPVDAT